MKSYSSITTQFIWDLLKEIFPSQAVPNFRHLKTFMAMGTDCKNNNNDHLSHQQSHIRKGEAVELVSRAAS